MIEKIQINNFRGIKSGKMERFRQFNLLVGPNNSGKSAVLEALYLASTATRPANLTVQDGQYSIDTYPITISEPDLLGQSPLKHCLARHNYYKASSANTLSEGFLKVQVPNHPIKRFELTQVSNEGFSNEEGQETALFRLEGDGEAHLQSVAQKIMDSKADFQENQHLLFCWHRDLTHYYRGSANWLITGQLASRHQTLFHDMFFTQKNMSLAFVEQNLATVPGWTQQIARHLANVFEIQNPFVVQFITVDQKTMQGWIAPADSLALPIDAWGDGARTTFKLLAPLIALANRVTPEAPGIVLWEDPELFQNPKTLHKLLREVVKIVRGKPIQIFMVSHSLEVVAHLTNLLHEGQIPEDDAMTFLLNLHEGELQSTWFAADNLISWLESGLDPRVWDDFVPPVQFRVAAKEEEQ
jgi:energy-coupling factor transporter ATP-binding protein EcfA2